MKVILLENIDRLGKIGDVVAVKEGYARNYLLPNNKAKEATAGNMKFLESLKKKQAQEEAKILAEARALADKIAALSITINAKAGEEEKLFGSITADMISDALKAESINIDKRDIIMDEPIKKLGVYQVTVKVHPEVKTSARIWVVKE
ncbi:MAG: 50S ribosomal protein L9 [Candidatus Omnitrophica bacterium]|nr:50S ribosomal protein L9 [Candidatus Omnitrophota bacterium]